MKRINAKTFVAPFANDLDAYIPELWAQESLIRLESNLVAAGLVHRDFEDEIASHGDIVNTRRPASFTSIRKGTDDDVTTQDATATNIQVPLDQHTHVSFVLKDADLTKSFKDLVNEFLDPAVFAVASAIDSTILNQGYSFIDNPAGKLGTAATKQTVIDARTVMNNNKVPMRNRHLIVNAITEGDLMSDDTFHEADKLGDDGTALREGSLGRKFGFSIWMDQNAPSIDDSHTTVTGAVDLAAGYAKGTTVVAVDGFSAAIEDGSWITIAGDMTPQRVTATTGGATPATITFYPGLNNAVLDDAVITSYTPGAIDLVAGYAVGFLEDLTVDTLSVAPQVNQLLSFGTDTNNEIYGSMGLIGGQTTTEVALNRSLDVAVANNDIMGVGPSGNYSFAWFRDAIALVSRPLVAPPEGTGARSAVANANNIAVRITIAYDATAQGLRVTVDVLYGVKVLNKDMGVIFLG